MTDIADDAPGKIDRPVSVRRGDLPATRLLGTPPPWMLAAGAALFCLLAIMNSGGYRYGVADQAFYVPAVLRHVDDTLFPRDRVLLEAEDRYLLFDNAAAAVVKETGLDLPGLFLILFLGGLVLLLAGAIAAARCLYSSWWSVALLGVALTFRHRIPRTGVNTLEAYFHPRMVAFALGIVALALFLRGRPRLALASAAAGMAFNPLVGLWMTLWLGLATLVAHPAMRRRLIAAAAVSGVALAIVGRDTLASGFLPMTGAWLATIGTKDYLVATDWPAWAWAINCGYLVVVLALYRVRREAGLVSVEERAAVAGCIGLFVVFVASLPLVALRLPLPVQLQISRIFWILDFMATLYVVWWIAERPAGGVRPRIRFALMVLALATIARGTYVMEIEHPERAWIRVGLPSDDWQEVMRWARRTPSSAHLLVDPQHAWRYGSSVRVAGERDVYLEEVKDTALATYSRDVADRVRQRLADLGDFAQLTPARARILAAKYGLHYVVTEQTLNLPLVFRTARFNVYRLGGVPENQGRSKR